MIRAGSRPSRRDGAVTNGAQLPDWDKLRNRRGLGWMRRRGEVSFLGAWSIMLYPLRGESATFVP
jgi:hypothetical protein